MFGAAARAIGLGALVTVAGCVVAGDAVGDVDRERGAAMGEAPIGTGERAIIGGEVDEGDIAVAMLERDGTVCTGAVIAPRVVLTAAHCVAEVVGGTASFGTGSVQSPFFATRAVLEGLAHRQFADATEGGFDVGLVRIEPAPPEVVPLALAGVVDATAVGDAVRSVGFGVTDGATQTGDGVKRAVTLPVLELTETHIVVGDADRNTCQGDSGGPTLLESPAGEPAIAAVTSFGAVGCQGPAFLNRVDVHAALIAEVVAAWDGPCRLDGACQTDGCGAFADPDCDPCGLDGTCQPGCPRVDLDCPLGGLAGDACAADGDCESRLCDADGVCVDQCGDGLPACGADTACCAVPGREGVRACLPASGGCAVGGAAGGAGGQPLASLVLVLLSLLAARRWRFRIGATRFLV